MFMDNACKLFDHINIAKSNCVCHFLVSRNYRHVTFAKKNGLFAIISRLNLTLTIVNVREKVTSHLDAGTIIWTTLQAYPYLSTDIFETI